MLVLTKKDIMFYSVMMFVVVISLATPFCIQPKMQETMSKISSDNITIIVDAGHGEPDGGAVSNDGVKEADLNLAVAKKLESLLLDEGFDVIMTRETNNNIADGDKQSTTREMKVSDINNRINIANNSGANFLISIHMNKFTQSKYRGWQTFYSKKSEESKMLAESIQKSIGDVIDYPNTRAAHTIEGIKLVDKSTIPTVIVECGFLSNEEEKKLLQTDLYQEQLAEGILNGILNYLDT